MAEGFRFAYSSDGIITMIKEFEMKVCFCFNFFMLLLAKYFTYFMNEYDILL